MTKRIYDFRCENGHTTEKYISEDITVIMCDECGKVAKRALSTPMFKFSPTDMSFGTNYSKWGKQRSEFAKLANKRYRDHGEDTYL